MNGQTTRTAIASGTCITLGIAISVALGVVPQASAHDSGVTQPVVHGVGSDVPFRPLLDRGHVAAQTSQQATPTAGVHHSSTTKSVVVAPAVQTGTARSATAHLVSADAAAPATKHPAKHHKKKAHHKKAHHKVKPTPKKAARTHPSQAAISSAIAGLKNYVRSPFSPSSAQVAQFGDQVCSAFDKNETVGQIESAILQKVKQLPFTTVESGAAGYVVRTAVKLYCPGYTSRLG